MRHRFVPISAVRAQGGRERDAMRSFPPLAADHPSVGGECAVCGRALETGDVVTIIPLGPGADPEARASARRGGWYSCLGAIAHAACAGLGARLERDNDDEQDLRRALERAMRERDDARAQLADQMGAPS